MSTHGYIADPPEGVARDVDGQTLVQQRIIVDSSITLSIALFILACRLYSRLFITRSFGLDDYAIIVAMLFAIVFFVCCLCEMGYGLGKHYWDVPIEHEVKYITLMIPFEISYLWCPMMTKISLLIFFHRLSSTWYFRFLIYALTSITAVYTIVCTVIVPAECIKPTEINDTCIYSVTLWQSVLNISTNVIVIFLPIPLLWKMRLPFSQKFGAGVIFSMGLLVVAASIVRVKYILAYRGQLDFTYYQAATINLGAAELNCGIMCSCLAVMKPFILHLFPSLNSSSEIHNSTAPNDRPGFNDFLKRRARHSYQLGYVGHKELPDDRLADMGGKSGIVVTNSYHVDIDEEARNSRTESTENIIPAKMRDW